jgi:hypothetical protein
VDNKVQVTAYMRGKINAYNSLVKKKIERDYLEEPR